MTEPPDAITRDLAVYTELGALAGITTRVFRRGEILHRAAVGFRDRDAGVPLAPTDLFRIASLTKPITSVLALMLVEEGRFALEDPITRFAPELTAMRVLRAPSAALDDTVPAERAITFEDLLTHRAGITYADFAPGTLADAYRSALGADIDSTVAPDAFIANLARLPLVAQPGSAFHYGRATDLLGLLIARMEDAPLGDVLARRLFGPLGMKDTSFTVPAEARPRRAGGYGFDAAGALVARSRGPGGCFLAERPRDMRFVSGGQGLFSTADDYLRFARLFVGDGSVDGVRVLRPETLALMTTNRLTADQRRSARLLGAPVFGEGLGFGLGVAVVLSREHTSPTICAGGVGTVGWPGAFGSWWQADPTTGTVMIFLTHSFVELEQLVVGIGLDVYEAIARFHAGASALT